MNLYFMMCHYFATFVIAIATGGHPFWVVSGDDLKSRPACDVLPDCEQGITPYGRWVYARDLCVGDVVRSRLTGTAKVTGLDLAFAETMVYNFSVDELHNYAVGANEVLVHNTNGPGNAKYMVRKQGLTGKDAATDVPSYAKGKPPIVNETPTQFAERIMQDRYGKNWREQFQEQGKKIKGAKSEFSQIEKSFRGFEPPKMMKQ